MVRGLSFIIALIGVVAMLTLGASGASARTAAPMSCHDSGGNHGGMTMTGQGQAPTPSPAKTKMVMACCAACVSPALPEIPATVARELPRPLQPARISEPRGRTPSPEPGPPRPAV